MAFLTKCCYCINLRSGVLLYAFTLIVLSALSILLTSMYNEGMAHTAPHIVTILVMLLLIYGTVKYNTKVILVCIALLSIIILWNIIDAIVITSKFIHEREAVPSIFSLVVSCFHLYMLYVLKALYDGFIRGNKFDAEESIL
nr:uncharacterized protein LOC121121212 [Lepeophtheirus salmonis]